jgi:hypothetical protein
MTIYNLKNDDDDEQVIEEIPYNQGIITTKKPFSGRKGNIYYNDILYSITQGFSKENLKYIVEALNKAYQNGFSEGASLMLNKYYEI